MLLQRGASFNLQDFCGITALMNAAVNCHTAIVQALLDAKRSTPRCRSPTAARRSCLRSMHVLRDLLEERDQDAYVDVSRLGDEEVPELGGGGAAGAVVVRQAEQQPGPGLALLPFLQVVLREGVGEIARPVLLGIAI